MLDECWDGVIPEWLAHGRRRQLVGPNQHFADLVRDCWGWPVLGACESVLGLGIRSWKSRVARIDRHFDELSITELGAPGAVLVAIMKSSSSVRG